MSNYKVQTTKLKDKDCIIKALEDKGFHPEYNTEGIALVGFQGDYRMANGKDHTKDESKAMRAEIVLRRKEVGGASNDIGFVKQEDGTYKAIISDYDSHKYNSTWLNKLTDKYCEHKVKKIAKAQGLTFVSQKDENGATKIIYQQVNG